MDIIAPDKSIITDMIAWEQVFVAKKKGKHWKTGRSAKTLADFMLNLRGESFVIDKVSKVIGENVDLLECYPEKEKKFDQFRHGREHDLWIIAKSDAGKKVYIGVEAKVDESFGPTIGEAYLAAQVKRLNGKNTGAPERIEQLMKRHFKKITPGIFKLPYQLTYATAGSMTLSEATHVMLTIVFKTSKYNKAKGKENLRQYLAFMKAAGAKNKTDKGSDTEVHMVEIDDKDLLCVHSSLNI